MEFTNNPRNVNPRPMPNGRPQPQMQRRAFSDFTPRPASPTGQPLVRPNMDGIAQPKIQPQPQPQAARTPAPLKPIAPPPRPMPVMARPVPAAAPQPHQQHSQAGRTQPHHAPQSSNDIPAIRPMPDEHEHHAAKKGKRLPHQTAHAGLVGFVFFAVFGGLLLSPLLPGKILEDFPLSSQTLASGDQSFACISEMHNVQVAQKYTLKLGWPVTYKYTTATTRTGECNGKTQSITGDSTGQFNPLGLLMDTLAAVVVTIAVAKLWRKVFSPKD